jgi:DNA-binding transcriptional MerR regulator
MKIGELAKQTGLTASRIRYYESTGLIKSEPRGSNGYREFAAETKLLLDIIVKAQQAGFSLEEIHHLLPNSTSNTLTVRDHDALLQSLKAKVVEIDAILQRLMHNKSQLLAIIAKVEAREVDVPCSSSIEQMMESLCVTAQ